MSNWLTELLARRAVERLANRPLPTALHPRKRLTAHMLIGLAFNALYVACAVFVLIVLIIEVLAS